MSFVCSICRKTPIANPLSPGSWECACVYDNEAAHWEKPVLVPDDGTAAVLSPVTTNPDEDKFYGDID